MLKKYIFLSILIISSVFLSGCVFDNNNKPNQTIGPDFIPRTNLPAGFTFMGIHDITMDIANSSVSGFEGVYRYGGDDIYITAVKHDDPEALLSEYKADLREPFKADYLPDLVNFLTKNQRKVIVATNASLVPLFEKELWKMGDAILIIVRIDHMDQPISVLHNIWIAIIMPWFTFNHFGIRPSFTFII